MVKLRVSLLFIFLSLLLMAFGCTKNETKEVVIYTSVDQIFSEPILQEFERETGIKVKAVYDVEASKTVGLVNRLLAEKDRPQCDVFWNSEFSRTIVLKNKGVLMPYQSSSAEDIPPAFKDKDNYWTGFAARARVLIYNTEMLQKSHLPESIFDLTEPQWKGKFVLAYPLFGTTATHIAALYAVIGKEKTENYLKALNNNGVVIVDGNSVARDVVVQGQMPLGFTDTDDVNVALQSGKPVQMFFPDKNGIGTLLIPNTLAMIKNCPHREEAEILIDYLLSRKVESQLAFSQSAQIPVRDGVEKPSYVPDISSLKVMDVDFVKVSQHLNEAALFCQELFVR